MSTARVIGGLLTLLAAIFILIIVGTRTDLLQAGGADMGAWIINLIIGGLALIGGLVGFGTRGAGGLVIVCAIISMILGILAAAIVDFQTLFAQFSTFQIHLGVGAWGGVTFEAILMLIGGIFIAASGR